MFLYCNIFVLNFIKENNNSLSSLDFHGNKVFKSISNGDNINVLWPFQGKEVQRLSLDLSNNQFTTSVILIVFYLMGLNKYKHLLPNLGIKLTSWPYHVPCIQINNHLFFYHDILFLYYYFHLINQYFFIQWFFFLRISTQFYNMSLLKFSFQQKLLNLSSLKICH